jgi:hypothetical protein
MAPAHEPPVAVAIPHGNSAATQPAILMRVVAIEAEIAIIG